MATRLVRMCKSCWIDRSGDESVLRLDPWFLGGSNGLNLSLGEGFSFFVERRNVAFCKQKWGFWPKNPENRVNSGVGRSIWAMYPLEWGSEIYGFQGFQRSG